jgi:hypothetical protein
LLINLQTLEIYNTDILIDSNISTLVNLKSLKCKCSTITSIDHLLNLEVLHLGLNYRLKSITNQNLKILSIINSVVNYINLPNLLEITLNEYIMDNLLCNHIKLKNLYLGSNIIITDKGIKTLTKLKYIHCNINKNITSNGIYNAINLVYIHAGMSYIDLSKLQHLTNLQYVEQYDSYLGYLESVILLDNRSTIK